MQLQKVSFVAQVTQNQELKLNLIFKSFVLPQVEHCIFHTFLHLVWTTKLKSCCHHNVSIVKLFTLHSFAQLYKQYINKTRQI